MTKRHTYIYKERVHVRARKETRSGMLRAALAVLASVFLLLCPACSDSEDDDYRPSYYGSKGTITLLLPVEGLGDGGYYDDIALSIFRFADTTGVKVRLLYPDSIGEARRMYEQWLAANDTATASVLVLTTQRHANFVRQHPPTLSGQGSGVIVIDPDSAALPKDHVSPIYIDRYSICYLAGAMCRDFSIMTLMADTTNQRVRESAEGFNAGHAAYAADSLTRSFAVLEPDESGFVRVDSVYRFTNDFDEVPGLMIFPVTNGSDAGVYRALENNLISTTLAVGMERNQGVYCSRTPFSVVYHIGNVVGSTLRLWNRTGLLPTRSYVLLGNGNEQIVFNDDFLYRKTYGTSFLWEYFWFSAENYFQNLYEQYRNLVPASPYMVH